MLRFELEQEFVDGLDSSFAVVCFPEKGLGILPSVKDLEIVETSVAELY